MRVLLIVLLGLVLVNSCGHKQNKVNVDDHSPNESVLLDDFQHADSQTVYRVPTPIEFFRFYQDAGGTYNSQLILSANNLQNYIVRREKAIAFGLYASDLAFSAVFGNNQQTISLFETSKVIADDLGLTEGYGEKLMKQFRNNLDNVDSLYHLTTDSYWKIFAMLEDQDQTELLSYIMVAGWVESLYLAINSSGNVPQESVKQCIADQQYVIENLASYLTTVHETGVEEDPVFVLVIELNKAFAQLYENSENTIITDKQFVEIRSKVNEYRSVLVK